MKKILIAEDNPDNRDFLCQALEDCDYEVVCTVDGAQAIEQVRCCRPDLILMDLSMPVLDGWEAARRLKADPELRAIPIIALSAHAMVGDDARALQAGCNDYLSKPISPARLLLKLEEWLGCRDPLP
ncbi:MAG: response regulator [Candidatus Latescibacteria bacterium]|nr:response regulator [Candidatus Latescibacterota bacterium]